MSWIDQNLDAYRVIAEILTDLRPLVRERLEAEFGREWFKDGIPEKVFDRLIRSKEREASIDWYENRYQEIIDYALFSDLFEIVIANARLFEPILKLAPSQSLLSTRFLELEVMRSKIGRARQVSDAEINFLTSFHLRFRKAMQELQSAAGSESGSHRSERGSTAGGRSKPEGRSADRPRSFADDPDPDEITAETILAPDDQPTSSQTESSPRPPQRLASPPTKNEAPTGPSPATDATTSKDDDETPIVDEDGAVDQPAANHRETVSATLKRAMDSNDHATLLRELYREVTGIAEVIWTTEEIPTTGVWDRVSTNPWYEKNFSKLELRPLSDFYDIIGQIRAKRQARVPKSEIQSYLNDSNFANILLALRDMFQKNKI